MGFRQRLEWISWIGETDCSENCTLKRAERDVLDYSIGIKIRHLKVWRRDNSCAAKDESVSECQQDLVHFDV